VSGNIEIDTNGNLAQTRHSREFAVNNLEPFKTTYIKKYNRSNYMYFLWPGFSHRFLQEVLLLALALSFASGFENGTLRI
jgi:ABC-2 type transport system permease protein